MHSQRQLCALGMHACELCTHHLAAIGRGALPLAPPVPMAPPMQSTRLLLVAKHCGTVIQITRRWRGGHWPMAAWRGSQRLPTLPYS